MAQTESQPPAAEVGLLLYPQCQTAMVYGMTDLLQMASSFSLERGGRPLRITHWAVNQDGLISRCQDTHPGLASSPEVLIIPGRLSGPMEGEEAAPFVAWLLEQHSRGATLAANCGGTFVLAATGLLSGRPATTHWLFADRFQAAFPDVLMDADRIVIEDGEIITAGGLMAWTDLAMRLVYRLLGPTIMVQTGQFFLIDPSGREQRHYSKFTPRLTHGDEAILKVQHWLQAKAGQPIFVSEMAQKARMEERTFLRRFKGATGLKPNEYVQNLRVGKAREFLESTKRSVDEIALSVGYSDSTAFRRLFNRLVGLAPSDYRRRFGVHGDAGKRPGRSHLEAGAVG